MVITCASGDENDLLRGDNLLRVSNELGTELLLRVIPSTVEGLINLR